MIFYCAELDKILFICGSVNVGHVTQFKVMTDEIVQEERDYTEFVENYEWVYVGIF